MSEKSIKVKAYQGPNKDAANAIFSKLKTYQIDQKGIGMTEPGEYIRITNMEFDESIEGGELIYSVVAYGEKYKMEVR